MRVVVLGATGLLGRAVTAELAGRGHEVVGVRPPPGSGGLSGMDGMEDMPSAAPSGALPSPVQLPVPGLARSLSMDVLGATETDLDAVLHGADLVVHALGPDVRDRPPAPAHAHFQRFLVDPTVRVARAASRQGVGHLVVLGSFYATFDRMHPQWRLAAHHPYIQARVDQARRAIAVADDSTAVSVLEVPLVFGTLPGAEQPWRTAFFDGLRRGPLALTLPGGAATVTPEDVATAVAGLAEGTIPPGRHPLATDNLTYRRLSTLVASELGRRVPTVALPGPAVGLGLRVEKLRLRRRHLGYGLDPARLAHDILSRTLFLDTEANGTALGLTPRPVDDPVRATVRAAYAGRLPG